MSVQAKVRTATLSSCGKQRCSKVMVSERGLGCRRESRLHALINCSENLELGSQAVSSITLHHLQWQHRQSTATANACSTRSKHCSSARRTATSLPPFECQRRSHLSGRSQGPIRWSPRSLQSVPRRELVEVSAIRLLLTFVALA